MTAETIVAAAVRYKGLTVSLPAPARHHHILHVLDDPGETHDQGFLTSTGRYVDRVEGGALAKRYGVKLNYGAKLFSEDLW